MATIIGQSQLASAQDAAALAAGEAKATGKNKVIFI